MTDRIDDEHRDDTTRAVAHLPGLDIEVAHSRGADAERISIHLQAMPSFAAVGNFLDGANPFAFWARAAQLAWQPFMPASMQMPMQSWTAFSPLMPWMAPWMTPWLTAMRALPTASAGETPPTAPKA